MDTTNCIVCGAPVRITTGHLMHQRRMIMAGFCSDECIARRPAIRGGRFGDWEPDMGATHHGKLAVKTACDCGPTCAVWRLDHPEQVPVRVDSLSLRRFRVAIPEPKP